MPEKLWLEKEGQSAEGWVGLRGPSPVVSRQGGVLSTLGAWETSGDLRPKYALQ